MNSLILYTTAGCHLCQLAHELLQALTEQYDFEIITTEIGDDEDLTERYGTKIPVIKCHNGNEIAWPFEHSDIESLLTNT